MRACSTSCRWLWTSSAQGVMRTVTTRVQLEQAVDEAWGAMKAEDVTRAAHHLNDVFCAIIHFKGGNMYRRASKFAVADY